MGRKGLNVKRTWGGKEKLNTLIKSEKNSTIKERLQAVLWRLENTDYTEIAKRLNRSNDTTTQWIKRWNKEGYKGLIDKPRSGRPQTLSFNEEKEIIQKTIRFLKILNYSFYLFKSDWKALEILQGRVFK